MKNLVIIPTYNELDNIRPMIDKVFSLSEKFDLLVIDEISMVRADLLDAMNDVLRRYRARLRS